MSLEDFIAHLPSQPWASAYIHNFLNSSYTGTLKHPISSAFSWGSTLETGQFWSRISHNYVLDTQPTRDTFKSELLKLKDTHPELFL